MELDKDLSEGEHRWRFMGPWALTPQSYVWRLDLSPKIYLHQRFRILNVTA